MSIAVVTGSSGLIGSEAARFLHARGLEIEGIDNDLRRYFFGEDASTRWNADRLAGTLRSFRHHDLDIRDEAAINALFARLGKAVSVVVHTAAQPSHDWAAREPLTDFSVNATGTLVLLEATRRHCPEAVFLFTSTNKVYGDTPNRLPLVELETRWEVDPSHPYAGHGIDEGMSLDQSQHSLFGASKVAADILVQEYGRSFGLKTGVFRAGCLSGPAHSGAQLHGFLAYLARCVVSGAPYTVFGYRGKQVRDNLHSLDLIQAFWQFIQHPRPGGVYNMGGGRQSNCSVLEAIALAERLAGRELCFTVSDEARAGDHIWYVSDCRRFEGDYPGWSRAYDLPRLLGEIVEAARERGEAA